MIDQITVYVEKKIHGFTMFIPRNTPGVSEALRTPLFFRKWHREAEFMDIILENFKQEDLFCEIGSNIGYVTLYILSMFQTPNPLLCIEPDERSRLALMKSMKSNDVDKFVTLVPGVIANKTGQVKLYLSRKPNLNSILEAGNKDKPFILVNSYTFDDFLTNFSEKRPTFIKMDIEGAEIDVFEGMKGYLTSPGVSKILMELHPNIYINDEERFRSSFQSLFENGYKLRYLSSAGTYETDIFSKLGYSPKRKYNDGMWRRALYENVSRDHFFQLALNTKFRRFKLGEINWWVNPIKALRSNLGSNKLIRTAFFEKTMAIIFGTFHLHELTEAIFFRTCFIKQKQNIMLASEEMQFVKMCLDII